MTPVKFSRLYTFVPATTYSVLEYTGLVGWPGNAKNSVTTKARSPLTLVFVTEMVDTAAVPRKVGSVKVLQATCLARAWSKMAVADAAVAN